MNCLIAKLILLITVFVLLIFVERNKEQFFVNNSENLNDSNYRLGFFSIVNIDDTTPEGYDLELEGPKCVAQCVAEHGANLLFTNRWDLRILFYWNKGIQMGYCYRANSTRPLNVITIVKSWNRYHNPG